MFDFLLSSFVLLFMMVQKEIQMINRRNTRVNRWQTTLKTLTERIIRACI
jgi:hypothetical protein